MNEISTPNAVGNSVKVHLDRVSGKIPQSLTNQLRQNPVGKIVDFKITDGQGIGYIIEFGDGSKNWFFENEVEINSSKETPIITGTKIVYIKHKQFQYHNLLSMLNPKNFIEWLIYSLKDVV